MLVNLSTCVFLSAFCWGPGAKKFTYSCDHGR